jgi:hypothetical protein
MVDSDLRRVLSQLLYYLVQHLHSLRRISGTLSLGSHLHRHGIRHRNEAELSLCWRIRSIGALSPSRIFIYGVVGTLWAGMQSFYAYR